MGFSVLSLPDEIAGLSAGDLRELEDFTREALVLVLTGQFPREAYETFGMDAADIEAVRHVRKEIALGSEYALFRKLFRREMHSPSSATCSKVGLLNERTSAFMREMGINGPRSPRPPEMATAPSQNRGRMNGHDWRAQLGAKLIAADEAVAHIKSGDRVVFRSRSRRHSTLCAALAGRLMEIENVVVNHGAADLELGPAGPRRALPARVDVSVADDRPLYHRGAAEFTPIVLLPRRRSAAGARQFQR